MIVLLCGFFGDNTISILALFQRRTASSGSYISNGPTNPLSLKNWTSDALKPPTTSATSVTSASDRQRQVLTKLPTVAIVSQRSNTGKQKFFARCDDMTTSEHDD